MITAMPLPMFMPMLLTLSLPIYAANNRPQGTHMTITSAVDSTRTPRMFEGIRPVTHSGRVDAVAVRVSSLLMLSV